MSNPLAIAAVTTTLHSILDSVKSSWGLTGIDVTVRPPDKARDSNSTGNQINLFLYQTMLNPAWRNRDMPRQVQPGETGLPSLPLNLHYLITVYGQDNNDTVSHQLLGQVMSHLHDYPVLSTEDIRSRTGGLVGNDLADQLERIRITHLPMAAEEMFKMWSGFQTNFRLSVAYEVAVVLIESSRPTKTPLPVLTRGRDDSGINAQANLIPPYPALEAIELPNGQTVARLGDSLNLLGHHLDGDSVAVRFSNPRLTDPIIVTLIPTGTAEQISFVLPDDPLNDVAGFYTVAAIIDKIGEPSRTTNELPLAIAPRILAVTPDPATRDGAGNVTLTLTCSPQVRPEQRVSLLLGDRELLADPHSVQTDTLTFQVEAATPGQFWLRLRVDGVDSVLVNRATTPPTFDGSQRITIA